MIFCMGFTFTFSPADAPVSAFAVLQRGAGLHMN
jgi:hypothetical protein